MTEDDLGYLLRRSNDERRKASEAADSAVRSAHDTMAVRYAEKAAALLAKAGKPAITQVAGKPAVGKPVVELH